MRYPASEKLEIIRLVEESRLPVKRTLEKLGVSRSKFYRWYDLHCQSAWERDPGSARNRGSDSLSVQRVVMRVR